MRTTRMNKSPRLIINLDEYPWNEGPHSCYQVAQLLVLKGGKKAFVNVELVTSKADGESVVIRRIQVPDSTVGDQPVELDLKLGLDVDEDEYEAFDSYDLKVLG